MTSLAFTTLFLGLVSGVRPVEVVATGPVAEVAFELDGKEVVRLFERPYRQPVDFGDEYSPHELVARAFDPKGQEVAVARQWINLPRPPAEVEILLETDKSGKAVAAKLAWASRMGPQPTSVMLSFDGNPLTFDATRGALLPKYDSSLPHVLSAQLEFAGGISGHADRVLGGGAAEEAGSNLTAIAVRGTSEQPPSIESLQGRFRTNGEALRVMAVEHGPALVMLVRDPAENKEAFRRFGPYNGDLAETETRLEIDDRIQLVWPLATEVPDQHATNLLFDATAVIHGKDTNFLAALMGHFGKSPAGMGAPRFADAVAVAGITASAAALRRAVVLIIGENDSDHSPRSAASIRYYLERINVPLYVWSLAPEKVATPPAAAWGEYDDISSVIKLRRAASRVKNDLARQSVVWIEGRHLPQDIVLADGSDGLAIAR